MKIQQIEVIQIETPRFYGHISGHTLVKVNDTPVHTLRMVEYALEGQRFVNLHFRTGEKTEI